MKQTPGLPSWAENRGGTDWLDFRKNGAFSPWCVLSPLRGSIAERHVRVRVNPTPSSKDRLKHAGRSPSAEPASGAEAAETAESSGPAAPASVESEGWQTYLLSLPERALRSATAVSAGLLRELSDVALPLSLRRTKLYEQLVYVTLRFLIEQVGEVEGAYPAEGRLSDDFAHRRAAGNAIELLGIVAFRASPVWVMAALADVSGAGRRLVREISESLKQEGLLDPETEFETVDGMLDGLEKTSGRLAQTINMPPLDVPALRQEWAEIRELARRVPPSKLPSGERLWQQWGALRQEAAAQDRSVFQLSSVMALSAVARLPRDLRWLSRSAATAARRSGQLVAGALLDDYTVTLNEIQRIGFLKYWTRQFRPYLKGAARQFSRERVSLTERLLSKRRR